MYVWHNFPLHNYMFLSNLSRIRFVSLHLCRTITFRYLKSFTKVEDHASSPNFLISFCKREYLETLARLNQITQKTSENRLDNLSSTRNNALRYLIRDETSFASEKRNMKTVQNNGLRGCVISFVISYLFKKYKIFFVI